MAARTVVLDANIYVSALAFGGKPKRALQLGITRRDIAHFPIPFAPKFCARCPTNCGGQKTTSARR